MHADLMRRDTELEPQALRRQERTGHRHETDSTIK